MTEAEILSQAISDPGLLSGAAMLIILALLGAKIVTATSRIHSGAAFEAQLFVAAILIRFAVSVGLYSFGLVEIIKDEDASGWLRGGSYYLQWRAQGYTIIDVPYLLLQSFQSSLEGIDSYAGYHRLLGALFLATDTPTRLFAAVMNNFFGAMTVVFIYRIASALFSQWVAVRTAWIVCFLPSMVLWGAQTIKEPVVLFLEAATLYGCIRLRETRFSPWLVVSTTVALLALIPFRFYVTYIIGGAFILSLLVSFARSRRSNLSTGLAAGICILFAVVMSGVSTPHLSILDTYDLERIDVIRRYEFETTGSGVDWTFDVSTPYGKVMSIATGAVYFFLAPFPWEVTEGSLRMMFTAPEVLAWWALFFFGVLPGLRLALKHQLDRVQFLVFFTVGVAVLYSATFYNAGLAYRQRGQIIPWLLMFALTSFEQRMLQRRAAANWTTLRHGYAPQRVGQRADSEHEPFGPRVPSAGADGS